MKSHACTSGGAMLGHECRADLCQLTENSKATRSREVSGGGFQPPLRRGAPAHGRHKVAGWVALLVLVVLTMAAGSLAGLTLVYSVDLPQVSELERYKPLATTELYDVHGQL